MRAIRICTFQFPIIANNTVVVECICGAICSSIIGGSETQKFSASEQEAQMLTWNAVLLLVETGTSTIRGGGG